MDTIVTKDQITFTSTMSIETAEKNSLSHETGENLGRVQAM